MNINIEISTWDKIIAYAQSAYDQFKSEIGGMAIAYRPLEDSDEFIVDEPVILKQVISSGNCVLDKEALAEYYVNTAKKHKDKLDLSFLWWHSHHTMKAFWSGTDLTAIQEMAGGNYSFSLVVNLKEEYKFRVNIWNPIQIHQDVEINILKEVPNVDNEVKSLCDKPTYPATMSVNKAKTSPYANSYQYGMWNDGPPKALEDAVESVLKELAFGTIKPGVAKKSLEKINKEAEKTTQYSVGIPTTKQLKDNVLFIEADSLIHESKEIWDFESEIQPNVDEFTMYNSSYIL